MNSTDKRTVSERMCDSKAMTKAIKEAVYEAVREHKLLGYPIVVWKDGKSVWIPPEEIELTPPEGYEPNNGASRGVSPT